MLSKRPVPRFTLGLVAKANGIKYIGGFNYAKLPKRKPEVKP